MTEGWDFNLGKNLSWYLSLSKEVFNVMLGNTENTGEKVASIFN